MNPETGMSLDDPAHAVDEAIRGRVLSESVAPAASATRGLPLRVRIPSWIRRLAPRRNRHGRIKGPALIEALHGVAAAAASGLNIDDALSAIVEQAKRITDTDKAILCLLEGSPEGLRVDAETVVARGSRTQHPQEWWTVRIEQMADEVVAAGNVVVERDRERNAWIAAAPAPSRGGPLGILAAINSGSRAFTSDEVNFLGILSAFAATAIENARLAEQTRSALLASERDRISREMHDGLAQSLFSASLGLEVCARRLERDPEAVRERIEDVQKLVTDSLAELRSYIYDLRSPRLERLGLSDAVRTYLDDVTGGSVSEADLTLRGRERNLEEDAEGVLYRVAREAVTNAVRHSGCTRIHVVIEYGHGEVVLTIRDDGDGFDVQKAFAAASRRGSLGLRNMRDRVQALGGQAEVASSKGSGTYVRVRLPC
jgi:signal transduction histidine kinase